jgi:adenosylhomocysteine nucleosidase
MKILMVAALKRELAALAPKNLPEVELLDTGEGRANAERALREWLVKNHADAVICLGFAGALSPRLEIGDLLIDKDASLAAIVSENFASVVAENFAAKVYCGTIKTVDEILDAKGKGELAATLDTKQTACVEMESSAVAKVCLERNIPFLLVRAISDLFAEDFPINFNACRNADGRVSTAKVLRSVLLKPQAVRGLLALNRRANFCAANLALLVERLLPVLRQSVSENQANSPEK